MSRTKTEINEIISLLNERAQTASTQAIINVLENDLDVDEIQAQYLDDENKFVYQYAIGAREWLDGEIDESSLI